MIQDFKRTITVSKLQTPDLSDHDKSFRVWSKKNCYSHAPKDLLREIFTLQDPFHKEIFLYGSVVVFHGEVVTTEHAV